MSLDVVFKIFIRILVTKNWSDFSSSVCTTRVHTARGHGCQKNDNRLHGPCWSQCEHTPDQHVPWTRV